MQINISKNRELHTSVCQNIYKPVGYMIKKAKCDFNADFYNSARCFELLCRPVFESDLRKPCL